MHAFSAGKRHVSIHDVITTPNRFPYTVLLNSCLSMLEIIKLNKSDVDR